MERPGNFWTLQMLILRRCYTLIHVFCCFQLFFMVGKGLILLLCTVFAGYHMASETVLSRFGTNCFRKLATMFAHSHVYNQSRYVFCACCVTVKTAILCLCVAQNAPTLQHHLVTKNQYYFCTSKHSTAFCSCLYMMYFSRWINFRELVCIHESLSVTGLRTRHATCS